MCFFCVLPSSVFCLSLPTLFLCVPLFSCQRLSDVLIYKQPLYHFKHAPEYLDLMNVAQSCKPSPWAALLNSDEGFMRVTAGLTSASQCSNAIHIKTWRSSEAYDFLATKGSTLNCRNWNVSSIYLCVMCAAMMLWMLRCFFSGYVVLFIFWSILNMWLFSFHYNSYFTNSVFFFLWQLMWMKFHRYVISLQANSMLRLVRTKNNIYKDNNYHPLQYTIMFC